MLRRVLRVALLVTLALLGLSEAQLWLRGLEGTSRRRDELAAQVRLALERARPFVEGVRLRSGAREATRSACNALPLALAAEAELFDAQGRRLAAFPAPAPVTHALEPEQARAVEAGRIVSVGPLAGVSPRLLSYMRLRCCAETLRLATPADSVLGAVQEQHRDMSASLVRLAVLVLATLLALLPERSRPAASPADAALRAYQEAVTRLKLGREQEQQRHERDLRRMEDAQRDLEVLARAGELTAGIVHEVRNGLGAILGNARLLEEQAGEPQRPLAADIRRECESLALVVRRFVEFAQREALASEPFDPRRLVERVIARETGGHDVTVAFRHDGLGELRGDEALLERAVENLMRNAREAAGPGGRLDVLSILAPPLWRLEIGDSGPGFPQELLEAAPRPFFSRKPGGLGLGLALATKIVRLHGGTLSLRAGNPAGGLVVVELPTGPPDVA